MAIYDEEDKPLIVIWNFMDCLESLGIMSNEVFDAVDDQLTIYWEK